METSKDNLNRFYRPIYYSIFILGLMFPPLFIVVILWYIQKYIPVIKTLYLCSIFSLVMVSSAIGILYLYPKDFLFRVSAIILCPGDAVLKSFVISLEPVALYIISISFFSVIFYTIVLSIIFIVLSVVKRIFLCFKAGRASEPELEED